MWIHQQFNKSNINEPVLTGTVMAVKSNKIDVSALSYMADIPVMFSFDVHAMPNLGDTVVLLPLIGGSYICIGKISFQSDCSDNSTTFITKNDIKGD